MVSQDSVESLLSHENLLTIDKAKKLLSEMGLKGLAQHVKDACQALDDSVFVAIADTCPDTTKNGPLSGIPFGVKDNIDALPYPTTGGSPALAANIPPYDAPTVSRMKEAGAWVAAKPNLHELAFGVTSNNLHTGVVRNPYDGDRVAGGSSGGNGAAIAAGALPFALGTDTGGSVRIPASFCGIVGFRPSAGRYPDGGVLTLSTTRDTVGFMCGTCSDMALLDRIMVPENADDTPDVGRPIRVGVMHAELGLSPTVDAQFQKAVTQLETAGVIETVSLTAPALDDVDERFGTAVVFNEALPVWTEFCDTRLNMSLAEFADTIVSPDVRGVFSALPNLADETKAIFETAKADGLPDLLQTYEQIFQCNRLDCLLMPTVSVQPPRVGNDEMMPTAAGLMPVFPTVTKHTSLSPLIGTPSLSLPGGLDEDGLPVGLMIEGLPRADRKILSIASAMENILRPDL